MIRLMQAALAVGLAFTGGAGLADPSVEVVPRGEVEFIPLNPARGDASPKAGVLWGDIRKDVPSGALITFADGFSSPPHIHNITYRAVVIDGLVHNDDPSAEPMWMKPGSFWTQPAGAPHITAVGPGGGTAFLEILSGPYLVQPTKNAFDRGEQPVNLDPGNIVWISSADVTWIADDGDAGSKGPQLAFLWGTPQENQLNGTFAKLPAGFSGNLDSRGVELKVVVVQGQLTHLVPNAAKSSVLQPGSYFGSEGETEHEITCGPDAECILYVRAVGKYRLTASD